MKISRKNLLIEKESGTYGCPNFIDPKMGKLILDSKAISHDSESAMLFTEIMENFGIELIKGFKGKLIKSELIKLLNNATLDG